LVQDLGAKIGIAGRGRLGCAAMTVVVRQVEIENFKSIRKLSLPLGRVNVFIGANGAGKSNILEAIAYGAAASRDRLTNDYLAPRGVRFVPAEFMRSAFPESEPTKEVVVSFDRGDGMVNLPIQPEWDTQHHLVRAFSSETIDSFIQEFLRNAPETLHGEIYEAFARLRARELLPPGFMIFSPENSALRIFQGEQQVLPLGARGEGLFAHLKALGSKNDGPLPAIIKHLELLDWFEGINVPDDLAPGERSLLIRDKYLRAGALFDQRSANEGFLFLLFYLTLFVSAETPKFFAIDNVDAALNPKLATRLMATLTDLAKTYNKQALFTTHSPAVLNGLDLTDDEQRLFVVVRGDDGGTRVRRIFAPKVAEGEAPVPLADAFVRGYLGGLPDNF
jgi:hypothetical protein